MPRLICLSGVESRRPRFLVAQRGAVLVWKMAFEIHAIVKHSAEFDLAINARAVKQEVSRMFYATDALGNPVSAVSQVIRPRVGCDFRTLVAPDSIRMLGHVPDRLR
jgi:hypothetical protein